jgi:hypothetical protein
MKPFLAMFAAVLLPAFTIGATLAAPLANVALNKPASADSSYSIYVPSRGNDGDNTTIWNGGSLQACWWVDLQNVYSIQTIVASSNQWGGLTRFQVSSSTNGSNWTDIGNPLDGSGDASFSIDAANASMRYIRFCTLAGSNNWATLSELQALGVLATPVTVGGTVSGLGGGKTLILRNNGGDDLTLTANGSFTFATALAVGAAYAVTVRTQPSGQNCTVTNGTGTAGATVSNIAVACADTAAPAPVPTLSDWVLWALALLVLLVGGRFLRPA